MSSLRVSCPKCQAKLKVKPELAGRTASCPRCRQPLLIGPAPAPAPPPPPQPVAPPQAGPPRPAPPPPPQPVAPPQVPVPLPLPEPASPLAEADLPWNAPGPEEDGDRDPGD